MAAKVWKVVNSPFYRTSDKELPSLVQALSILGLRNFYCVVLTSSLKEILAPISHHSSTATAQWHALPGVRGRAGLWAKQG